MWTGGGGFHELHNLGTPDFLQRGLLRVHSGSLPLERRRGGWHRHSQNVVHGPSQMRIGIETQRRRCRHLCKIRQPTWRMVIYTYQDPCLDLQSVLVCPNASRLSTHVADIRVQCLSIRLQQHAVGREDVRLVVRAVIPNFHYQVP